MPAPIIEKGMPYQGQDQYPGAKRIQQPWEQQQGGGWGSFNPYQKMGLGMGMGGALGSIFGSLFGNQKSPMDAAMPYMEGIPGMLKEYLSPYHQAGMRAMPILEQQYGRLINDPTAIMSQIGKTYQASPGYQYQVDEATRAANQAAAAGGMLGSPAEQSALAQDISGIANQDYWNYVNRGLGLYGQGLGGMGGMYQTGYGASSSLAQSLAQYQQAMAQMAYANQANQNQQSGGLFGSIGSLVGGLGGMFF